MSFKAVSTPFIKKVTQTLLTMQRYSWEQGVAAQAFLELGQTDLAVQLARDAVKRQTPDGRLACLHENEGVTDPAANGEAVLAAARLTREPAFQLAADSMLLYLMRTAPRASDGTLFHLTHARQIWVDSMYMAPPFLAVASEPDEALRQIEGIQRRLWNPHKQLYSHIWDENAGKLKRPDFWGGGNGWAAAGVTRVINALPSGRIKERHALAAHLQEILDGCLAHQRPDGLFHDILDHPDSFVETNLAQMLAYAIYRGLRGGWLPAAYKEPADRMRSAAHQKVDSTGYVQGVCASPTFDRPGTSPEGQAFFLLMESAFQAVQ